MVRNNAKETKTMFGGVAFVAKALRVMEKTTIKRVKDVIITKIDGATDKTVIIIITLNIRAVAEPLGASSTLRLSVCAQASPPKNKTETTAITENQNHLFFILVYLRFIFDRP